MESHRYVVLACFVDANLKMRVVLVAVSHMSFIDPTQPPVCDLLLVFFMKNLACALLFSPVSV
jgi:hypothetical protein